MYVQNYLNKWREKKAGAKKKPLSGLISFEDGKIMITKQEYILFNVSLVNFVFSDIV